MSAFVHVSPPHYCPCTQKKTCMQKWKVALESIFFFFALGVLKNKTVVRNGRGDELALGVFLHRRGACRGHATAHIFSIPLGAYIWSIYSKERWLFLARQ